MRTIIHDLNEEELKDLEFSDDDFIVDSRWCLKSCVGCFSCWTKHPKYCVMNDDYSNIVDNISKSKELVIISKSRYGCYSYSVKRVLERCIGFVLPYFEMREGMIHHKSRFNDNLKLCTYFYGTQDENDKKCVHNLVKANAINLNVNKIFIKYVDNLKEIKECLH